MIEKPTSADMVRKRMIERKIEIASSDKHFYLWGTAVIIVIGLFGMLYGFRIWHTRVQPLQDEFFALQKRKLELEVQTAEIKTKVQAPQTEEQNG